MRRYILALLFVCLVPCLAFGATATSTGSGNWSEAIWTGGAGSGGAPADGDAVVIAEGHSVRADVDLSAWTGLTTLTITGSASGTPGMLYVSDGKSTTLKFRTGTNYGIRGTNVTNKGRLLANSDGVWGNTGQLAFATKAIIQLDGTSLITATYLDIGLYCHEPANKYLTTYYDKYAVAGSGVNTTTNVITMASAHGWSANRTVKVKSTGTLPTPLTTTDIYYVGSPSGADLKLLYASGGTEVDLTSSGSGTIEIYSGYETYAGVVQLNVFEDVTADTGWTATDGHDAVVLADIGPADYDQQRTTLASIDSATQVTLAAALDSAQYPGARIYLSSRNISIRHNHNSTSASIISNSTGNTFGCEIKNNHSGSTGTTFYSYALNSNSNNNTISGIISGCNAALYSNSNNNTISGTISGCGYGLYNSSNNNTVSGIISGCSAAISSSNNNTISGTINGCSAAISSSNNNTISGTISGCSYGLYNSSNNNTVSGIISGCSYGLYNNSNNNTISGIISGCSYDIRGQTINNYLILPSDRSVLSFYPGTRNTKGTDSRTGLQTPSTEAVYDAWGTVQKVTADGTDQPSQRSGGSASVLQIDAQSNISASDNLTIFDHNIWIPASGSRTITYYAQTNYTSGLTADQVKLYCQYLSSADNNTLINVTSTQGVTIRDDEDDWDQYLQVTVIPAKAGYVTCRATLSAYESGKYLWIDPMLVTTGMTIAPRWYRGESLIEAYTTPAAGGGGKWVY